MMLRREATVSYRPLRRRLVAYSFAALIVGAAALDATVFAPAPRESRVAAPVEVEPTPTPVVVEVPPQAMRDVVSLEPLPARVRWLEQPAVPGEHAADNRIDLDGLRYKVVHPGAFDGIGVGLRPRADDLARCPRGVLTIATQTGAVATHAALPLVMAYVQDGAYTIWVDCDGRRVGETRLVVEADARSAAARR